MLEGLTPEIAKKQARTLLDSIDTSTLVGQRDRLVLAILIYTAARGGEVAKLRCSDIEFHGTQHQLKVMFLAMERASRRWTRSVKDWTAALNQLSIVFGDRLIL